MSNNVNIIYSQSGLGSPATGEDFVSGIIYYTSLFPSGFNTGSSMHEIFSVAEAVSLGITNTHLNETPATGKITITAIGGTGDTITSSVTTPFGTLALGTYTTLSTDTTPSLIAAGVSTTINSLSSTTGFYASVSTSAVTITAASGLGLAGNYPNTTLSTTVGGTVTFTNTNFSGGIASNIDPMYYHISEYFRANPSGDLWVMVMTGTSSSSSYSEIVTLQNTSIGKLRQVGIYEQTAFSYLNLASIQTQISACITNNRPLEAFYTSDISSITNLATLYDLQTLNAPNVTVSIGQDGANEGYRLWKAGAKTIASVGLLLGATSKAKVNQSTAWVQNFNMSNVEMDTLAFGNGTLLTTISDALSDNIDSKGYNFLKKYVGNGGSYFNNNYTSISHTSDYSNVSNNRTIHKAARQVRNAMVPSIAAPVYFNADGSIALYSIGFFKATCDTALAQMQTDGEISQYKTIINANQNVLATRTLNISLEIVPVGVANVINITLGFVLNVA